MELLNVHITKLDGISNFFECYIDYYEKTISFNKKDNIFRISKILYQSLSTDKLSELLNKLYQQHLNENIIYIETINDNRDFYLFYIDNNLNLIIEHITNLHSKVKFNSIFILLKKINELVNKFNCNILDEKIKNLYLKRYKNA